MAQTDLADRAPPRRLPIAGLARLRLGHILFLLVVLFFAPALRNGFVWDDPNDLVISDRLHHWKAMLEVFQHPALWSADLPQGSVGTYRPLSLATFVVDYKIFGLNAAGFHLTSIVLHALTSVLLFHLFRRLIGSAPCAFVLALLCAVHPCCVEAVVWINGRSEVLALLSGTAALLWASEPAIGPMQAGACGLLLLAALLGKETGVIFLPLSVGLAALTGGPTDGRAQRTRRALLVTAGAAASLVIYVALRAAALRGGTLPPADHLGAVLQAIPAVWFRGFQGAALPLDQSIGMVGSWLRGLSLSERIGYMLASTCLVALLAYQVARRRFLVVFGLLWWLSALLPIALLVVRDWPGFNRWLYIGMPGLVLALWLAFGQRLGQGARIALSLALLAGMLALTERAIPVWHSDGRLFLAMIGESPQDYYGYQGLAKVMLGAGRYQEARVLFLKSLQLGADPRQDSSSMGIVEARLGKCDEARQFMQRYPDSTDRQYAFLEAEAGCYRRQGRLTEAAQLYNACAARLPACRQAIRDLH